MLATTRDTARAVKIAHERLLRLARSTQKIKSEMARDMLEDLVRAAYPRLADKCLCSKCLRDAMKRDAGRV